MGLLIMEVSLKLSNLPRPENPRQRLPALTPIAPKTSPLSKNIIMITAIALGAVFALFFTGVLVGSILATHGVAIPVFAFIAAKLTSITTVSSVIGSKILYGLFFGGVLNVAGAIVGKLYKYGERKSMEKFLLEKIFSDRPKSDLITPLSEKKLNAFKLKRHGTIFSCQSGHNFRKLDITKDWMCGRGAANKLKNIFTFISHMFILDPYESFKSLFNFKKYLIYKKNVAAEKRLKDDSSQESLEKLDHLFSARIDELILSKSIPAHNQYLINPELTVLDRYIAFSEAALDSEKLSSDEIEKINERISVLKEKKQKIIESSSPKADGFFSNLALNSLASFHASNLFEINKKIDALSLSLERKMQIREAVSILLTHPSMTIDDVNRVVNKLITQLNSDSLDLTRQWKTRESVLKYAISCYEEKNLHTQASIGTTPFIIAHAATNRAPMSVDEKTLSSKIARSFITDLAICLLPGAPVAAFLWTTLAISLSKHIDRLNTKPESPIKHR